MAMLADNLTDRELKWSYWFITNKLVLRRALVVFLIIISILMLFFISWRLAFYVIEYNNLNYQTAKMISGENLSAANLQNLKPTAIQISDAQIFPNDNGKNDYLVRVVNPNADWVATFDYQFSEGEEGGAIQKGFVLPGEEKYVMGLGLSGSGAQFQILNQKWQRVSNFERLYNERFRLAVSGEEFEAGSRAGDPNRLSFNLTNNSAYGFWEVGLMAILESGGSAVSINRITLNQLKSGETRPVEIFWNTRLPRVSGYQIIPEVNVVDEKNIMKPEGGVGEY